MSYQDLIQKDKIKWSIITFFSGTVLGLILFYIIKELSPKWALLCSIGMLICCFPLLIGKNVKHFFQAILILSLPLNMDIAFHRYAHLGGANGIMISLYDIVLAFLYLLWLSEIIRKKNIEINFFSKISIPALFLFTAAFFSMLNARFRILCVYEIIEMFKMYLGFFYLANHIKKETDVHLLIFFLLLGLFLEGLLGLAQFSSGTSFLPSGMGFRHNMASYESNYYRVSGTWVSYNDFAWYLTFIIPVSLSILFAKINFKYKYTCAFILFIGMGALLSTLSRAGYISISMAILFVLLLAFRKIKGKNGLYNFFVLMILFIGFILIIFTMNPKSLRVATNRMFSSDDRGSAESRIPQMKVAYSIIKSNPFLGIGINNYTEVMHDYDKTEEGLSSITNFQVHNIFLQIGAEMGVMGLVIFLWLVTEIFIEGLHYIKLNEGLMAYIVIGLLGGIIAFLIHGLVDAASIGNKLFLFLWLFAGIIVGIKKTSSYKQYV